MPSRPPPWGLGRQNSVTFWVSYFPWRISLPIPFHPEWTVLKWDLGQCSDSIKKWLAHLKISTFVPSCFHIACSVPHCLCWCFQPMFRWEQMNHLRKIQKTPNRRGKNSRARLMEYWWFFSELVELPVLLIWSLSKDDVWLSSLWRYAQSRTR